jgi:hypothetical protein
MGFARSIQLSDHNFRWRFVHLPTAGSPLRFFTVSGEPRALQFESQHYSNPGDAERAGYEAIAAKGLQTQDIDKARRAGSGQFNSSPGNESGEAEPGV